FEPAGSTKTNALSGVTMICFHVNTPRPKSTKAELLLSPIAAHGLVLTPLGVVTEGVITSRPDESVATTLDPSGRDWISAGAEKEPAPAAAELSQVRKVLIAAPGPAR